MSQDATVPTVEPPPAVRWWKRLPKWARYSLVVVAAVSLMWLVAWGTREKEPVVRGKTVTEWIANYYDTTNGTRSGKVIISSLGNQWSINSVLVLPTTASSGLLRTNPLTGLVPVTWNRKPYSVNGFPVTNPGREAIKELGKPAVPWLVKVLQSRDSMTERYYRPWWRARSATWQGILPDPGASSAEFRYNAASLLGDLQSAARPAVPALFECLASPDSMMRGRAGEALREILKDDRTNRLVEEMVTRAIFKPLTKDMVEALVAVETEGPDRASRVIQTMAHPNVYARVFAAKRFGDLEPAAARMGLPALVGLLKDREKKVADAAQLTLGKLCHDGLSADNELAALLDATPEDELALEIIGRADMSTPEAIQRLRKILRVGNNKCRIIAARYLDRRSDKAASAVPELIAALQDEDNELRYCAVRVLESLGPAAIDAVPVLKQALDDRNPMVSAVARRTLTALTRDSESVAGSDSPRATK